MHVFIRQQQRPGPNAAMREWSLDVDSVRIGRGSNQELQLSGLAVALEHAEITLNKRGPEIRSIALPGLRVNGKPCQRAILKTGDLIEIGGFELTVAASPKSINLSLQITPPNPELAQQETPQLNIDQSAWGLRRISWLLFFVIFALGLALPLLSRFIPATGPLAAVLPGENSWKAGTLSTGHANLEDGCKSCHSKLFQQVTTKDCLSCHESTPTHVGQEKLAHDHFDDCASCHIEHNGTTGMTAKHPKLCASCHADPEQHDIEFDAVSDFTEEHPAFTPAESVQKGLFFSHEGHLKPLETDDGERQLVCADCHQKNASDSGFLPLKMETHCIDCHRLDFDPDNPQATLPHGDTEATLALIRGYYSEQALLGKVTNPLAPNIVRRRPGKPRRLTVAEKRQALGWANRHAQQVIDEAFEKRTCGLCHVTESDENGWRAIEVELPNHWMTAAKFPHNRHEAMDCQSCHGAEKSEDAADVLMPELETCLTCHGPHDDDERIASSCVDCHGFHESDEIWKE